MEGDWKGRGGVVKKPPVCVEDTMACIIRSQNGDKEARDKIVQDNLGLVWSVVRRFASRGYESEDLFQIGCIGLMKAIDKFDVTMDLKLSTYAVPMIMGEIKRFLRDDGMIKVSRSVKENGWRIKKAADKIAKRQGRDATMEELEKETALSSEEIILAMEASMEVESIHKTVYQGDGSEITLADKLAQTKDDKEEILNHMLLGQLLAELEDKERTLIMMRYFQDKTQTEVAKELGISQVQVSRLEKKILIRMRQAVTGT